jgi:hypothetical protein
MSLISLFKTSKKPDVLKTATRFKAQLLRDNDKAVKEISKHYLEAWRRLKIQANALTKQIAEAQKSGEAISASWIFRQQRYYDLMLALEIELRQYGVYVAGVILTQQQLGLTLGLESSKQLALMQLRYGVQWNQPSLDAMRNLTGFLADGSPLAYKFAGLSAEVADGIKETLTSGLAQGWNPVKIAAEINSSFAGGLTNAVTTCRTEVMRAYRGASHENYRANSDIVRGWIWSAGHSPRTCAACWAMDGTFHTLDEVLIDHPAGRCCPVPVTRSWAEISPSGKAPGIKETSAQPWNSEETFAKLTDAEKLKVLGPGRFRLYQDGKIGIKDMAVLQKSEIWGDHYRPKTLKELTAEGKV